MKTIINKYFSIKESGIITVLVVLQIIAIFAVDNYATLANLQLILRAIPSIGVLSLGVCILMIAQEFDLSVGSTYALAPVIGGLLFHQGINIFLAFGISLIAGCVIGVINGLVTVKGKMPSFIVTMGTMMIFRAASLLLADGKSVYNVTTPGLIRLVGGQLGPIPVSAIWFVAFAGVFWALLNKHNFGSWVFATGGNKKAAKAMGINTDRVKLISFILTGFMAAFAGLLDAVRITAVGPNQGNGLALTAIAAVVIGGTSLGGGKGTIIGTFLGASLLFIIQDVLLLLRVSSYYFQLLVGTVIVLAVLLNTIVGRRSSNAL